MAPRVCVALVATLASTGVFAGQNGMVFFQSVPTLDEIGLGVLIALVAGVAGWAVRRGSGK